MRNLDFGIAARGLAFSLLLVSCSNSPAPSGDQSGGTDRGAPRFGGVAKGEAVGATDVRLSWGAAKDDVSPTSRIVYRAYVGIGEEPIPLGSPAKVSLPGETTLVVGGLAKGRYRFVVRAVDERGNEDDNVAAVRVSMGDGVSPKFEGVAGAVALSSKTVKVEWKPAQDDVSPAEACSYQVYFSTDEKKMFSNESIVSFGPNDFTNQGVTSVVLPVENAETTYFFGVRAKDEAGNLDDNERIVSTASKEGEPPSFGGLVSLSMKSTSAKLTWATATDNVTPLSGIVYEIFVGTKSAGYDLAKPTLVSAPGVITHNVTGLTPDTTYYFLVRARDEAGNSDGNAAELSGKTLPPDVTPPTFAGIDDLDAATSSTLSVHWSNASDETSAPEGISYRVYLAEGDAAFDFGKPYFVTAPGRESLEIFERKPGTKYRVVVRAVDEAGNEDPGPNELEATTPATGSDTTEPNTLSTITLSRLAEDPTRLLVNFPTPTDNVASANELRVHFCVSKIATGCNEKDFFASWNASSGFGATAVFLVGLEPNTSYTVVARVEDVSGNLEATGRLGTQKTAPSFEYNVLPMIQSRCNQCHDYSYASLFKIESSFTDPTYGKLYLVDPESAAKSYLVRKLHALGRSDGVFSPSVPNEYDGLRMPSDSSPYLSDETLAPILDWLSVGAFNN